MAWQILKTIGKSRVELFGHNGNRYIYGVVKVRNNEPAVMHGGGSIMLWGCFAVSGTGYSTLHNMFGIMTTFKFFNFTLNQPHDVRNKFSNRTVITNTNQNCFLEWIK